MDQLNYNHLYYFWAIAKEGGVTAACKKLRLSQPTLSGQLAQFEKHMGTPLFERRSRKLILNDKGKIIFDYADLIFKKGSEMMDALNVSAVKDTIDLTIGLVHSLPKKNIHTLLRRPLSHGKVILNIVVDTMPNLINKLKKGILDILISNEPAPKDIKGLYHYIIEKAPLIFVASPDYRNLRRKFPHSLHKQVLFLPTHPTSLRSEIDLYFDTHNIKPYLKGDIQDIEMLRVIAVGGHGIVAIPRPAVSDLLKSKELYIIGDNIGITYKHYLITNERKITHPTVIELLKHNY
ncbi:MAG: LysR family transcriptional regulator [bacterium]|nr:LysR family transcriptional regulator [bacterium]MBU1918116.1 LysR family transcriptional regulator [bacterium]